MNDEGKVKRALEEEKAKKDLAMSLPVTRLDIVKWLSSVNDEAKSDVVRLLVHKVLVREHDIFIVYNNLSPNSTEISVDDVLGSSEHAMAHLVEERSNLFSIKVNAISIATIA